MYLLFFQKNIFQKTHWQETFAQEISTKKSHGKENPEKEITSKRKPWKRNPFERNIIETNSFIKNIYKTFFFIPNEVSFYVLMCSQVLWTSSCANFQEFSQQTMGILLYSLKILCTTYKKNYFLCYTCGMLKIEQWNVTFCRPNGFNHENKFVSNYVLTAW